MELTECYHSSILAYILNHMAMVADEKERSTLRQVDLHTD